MCYISVLQGDKVQFSRLFDKMPMQFHQDVLDWIRKTYCQPTEGFRKGSLRADQLLLHARNTEKQVGRGFEIRESYRQAWGYPGGSSARRRDPDLLEKTLGGLSDEVGVMIIALWEKYYPPNG